MRSSNFDTDKTGVPLFAFIESALTNSTKHVIFKLYQYNIFAHIFCRTLFWCFTKYV